MDYEKRTIEELKKGYYYDVVKESYCCNYCDQHFIVGEMFLIQDTFYMTEPAAKKHVALEHGGSLRQLLSSDTKYNGLTDHQKAILTLFHSGLTDAEIAKKLEITESTVRHQRFTFKEKAKQAKIYLALYEQIFAYNKPEKVKIPGESSTSIYVDHRYPITEEEKQHIIKTSFKSLQPLVLASFSAKEKKKVVILERIASSFLKAYHKAKRKSTM